MALKLTVEELGGDIMDQCVVISVNLPLTIRILRPGEREASLLQKEEQILMHINPAQNLHQDLELVLPFVVLQVSDTEVSPLISDLRLGCRACGHLTSGLAFWQIKWEVLGRCEEFVIPHLMIQDGLEIGGKKWAISGSMDTINVLQFWTRDYLGDLAHGMTDLT